MIVNRQVTIYTESGAEYNWPKEATLPVVESLIRLKKDTSANYGTWFTPFTWLKVIEVQQDVRVSDSVISEQFYIVCEEVEDE